MARESKRKRDERRFGKPERLADIAPYCDWAVRILESNSRFNQKSQTAVNRRLKAAIAMATVVLADNVANYVEAHPREYWNYGTDIPSPVPFFDRLFIEYRLPREVVNELQWSRAGCLVESFSKKDVDGSKDADWFGEGYEDFRLAIKSDRFHMIVRMFLLMEHSSGSHVEIASFLDFPLDVDGQFMAQPRQGLFGYWTRDDGMQSAMDAMRCWFTPAMLALSFANCRNIEIECVEPNPIINRERKKQRLRPFVRYHTINIEPMKTVLRTEGNIETEGLKRALHICRGHFATYTDSFLGRTLEKPMTVWRPAHRRGSLKSGIVVSDYNVNPPKP